MNDHKDRTRQEGTPKRAFGRSLKDVQTQDTPSRLLPAEDRLLAAVARGERCAFVEDGLLAALDKGELCLLIDEKTCKNAPVRAEFLRFLALGGDSDHPMHEKGIQLVGAYVTGALDLYGCEVKYPLSFLSCWFEKTPNMRGAQLRSVSFRGSWLPGIDLGEAALAGALCLDQGFRSRGPVQIQFADILGELGCDGGQFQNFGPDGSFVALAAQGAKIAGSALFQTGFRAQGQVVLARAYIGGDLSCIGGRFLNRSRDGKGVALQARGAKVKGYFFLKDSRAEGGVFLNGAEIGQDLDCRDGNFINGTCDGQGIALDAGRVEVKGNTLLGLRAEGAVELIGARIDGQLSCAGGHFSNPAPAKTQTKQTGRELLQISEIALQLQEIKVGDVLFLGPPGNKPDKHVVIEGSLSLVGAYSRQLQDHPNSWPPHEIDAPGDKTLRCCIDLDGFVYDRITSSTPIDARKRKEWLHRQPPDDLGNTFSAQPFAHLVKVLRTMGHDKDARVIAADGEEFRRQEWKKTASWVKWSTFGPFWWLFGRLVGYGYQPERLLLILVVLWLGCALFYDQAAMQGAIAPSQPSLFLNNRLEDCRPPKGKWLECIDRNAPEYTKFNAYIYSADLMLPIVDLQQKRAWGPIWQKMTLGKQLPGWVPWALVWIETIFGWIGSLVLAAVLSSNLIRRTSAD